MHVFTGGTIGCHCMCLFAKLGLNLHRNLSEILERTGFNGQTFSQPFERILTALSTGPAKE